MHEKLATSESPFVLDWVTEIGTCRFVRLTGSKTEYRINSDSGAHQSPLVQYAHVGQISEALSNLAFDKILRKGKSPSDFPGDTSISSPRLIRVQCYTPLGQTTHHWHHLYSYWSLNPPPLYSYRTSTYPRHNGLTEVQAFTMLSRKLTRIDADLRNSRSTATNPRILSDNEWSMYYEIHLHVISSESI